VPVSVSVPRSVADLGGTAAALLAGWDLGGTVAALLAGWGLWAKRRDEPMTAVEKAYNALVILLCQSVADKDALLQKLQADLAVRPTNEVYQAAVKRELVLGDELRVARRECEELRKKLDECGPELKVRRRRRS